MEGEVDGAEVGNSRIRLFSSYVLCLNHLIKKVSVFKLRKKLSSNNENKRFETGLCINIYLLIE